MDSNILNALFRDPVINRLTSGKTNQSKPGIPESLVAKVTALKGDAAVLLWKGGNFTAFLDARVSPGETLFLKYSGIKEGRSQYRIMARLPDNPDSTLTPGRAEPGEPLLFGLIPKPLEKQGNSPALVRFLPPREQHRTVKEDPNPLLELFLDTNNFGMVLIRFYYHQENRLECHFVVESQEAGQALQCEAEKVVAEAGGQENNKKSELLSWSVGDLRKITTEVLHRGGFSLNTKA